MAATAQIVETAPVHGIDLTVASPLLPHRAPAPVREVPESQLDRHGVLATEPGGRDLAAAWRDTVAYTVPPLLDPRRTDLAAERDRLARESVEILTALQAASEQDGARDRGFQRKTLYVTTNAELRVPENVPRELQAGPFQPRARHRAILRFSSAAPVAQPDPVKDQRAVGIRITDDAGRVQDLTLTSGAAGNHARSAKQFNSSMKAALAMVGGGLGGRLRGVVGLLLREGPRETLRLSRARREAASAGVSLAATAYYSRSPVEMGRKLVHLALLPLDGTVEELVHPARGARDGLGRDLCLRRNAGDVRFRLAAAEAPGLSDTSVPPAGRWVTVAEIRLPRQAASEAEMLRAAGTVHRRLAMHPFHAWEPGALTPRGELNEILRRRVYATSARGGGRVDEPPATPQLGV